MAGKGSSMSKQGLLRVLRGKGGDSMKIMKVTKKAGVTCKCHSSC